MSGSVGDNPYRASGVVAAAAGGGGGITWSDSVKTSGFTADANSGYFVNTTSGGVTITLPASPDAGDIVAFVDYAGTADTNAIAVDPNGNKIKGNTAAHDMDEERGGATLTYIDSTQGWLVTSAANIGSTTLAAGYDVQYLVVAGGGGSAKGHSSGGGAGGYRTVATKSFNVTSPAVSYPITVGDGGTAHPGPAVAPSGTSSIFSTITSAGGGGGIYHNPGVSGGDGGSGGGGGTTGGTGNTPPVSPPQGNDGGSGSYGTPDHAASGGGGASAVGVNGTTSQAGGGGDGSPSTISGTDVSRGGGGAGSGQNTTATGGAGGGGNSSSAGTANTGGGGGGGGTGSAGGSGVVIIRRETAASTSTSGTVTTDGTDTIHTFTADGIFVT